MHCPTVCKSARISAVGSWSGVQNPSCQGFYQLERRLAFFNNAQLEPQPFPDTEVLHCLTYMLKKIHAYILTYYIYIYMPFLIVLHSHIFVHIFIYMYSYTHVHAHLRLHLGIHMYVCVCMYACMHVCMCVCTYVCMHACMYVCMYVCMCMYVCK